MEWEFKRVVIARAVADERWVGDALRRFEDVDKPGDYELKVVCDLVRGANATRYPVETPPLRIHVQPVPHEDAAALKDWDVDLAIFAQNDGGWGTSPRFQREARRALEFMAEHSGSPYAQALHSKTRETLDAMAREGVSLTQAEQAALERLKRWPATE